MSCTLPPLLPFTLLSCAVCVDIAILVTLLLMLDKIARLALISIINLTHERLAQ